ncbi:MAG: response regulator [Lutibacter sp.]|nr:response regulator [Lutibacter sp.]
MKKMTEKASVLYIDDVENNLNSFKRLYQNDYNITLANSAEQGIERIQTQHFHILLADQRMPGMTGVEFFKSLSKEQSFSMRILITAFADIDAVIAAINEGAVYRYVRKPFNKEGLKLTIDKAYNTYQYRKKLYLERLKYKDIYTHTFEAIFLLNQSGKIIDAHEAFLTLLSVSRKEIKLKAAPFVLQKSISKEQAKNLERTKVLENIEIEVPRSPGKKIHCLLTVKKIERSENISIGYIGFIRNIEKYRTTIQSSVRGVFKQQEMTLEKVVDSLHERSAQNLVATKFYLSLLEKDYRPETLQTIIESMQSTIDDTIQGLKNLCLEISPFSLSFELEKPLKKLCSKVERAYAIKCTLLIKENLDDLRKELKVVIFHTVHKLIDSLDKTEDIKGSIGFLGANIRIGIRGENPTESTVTIQEAITQIEALNGTFKARTFSKNRVRYTITIPMDDDYT